MANGIIKNARIDTNRDGENQVRLLDVEIDDGDDVQTCEIVSLGGVDYNPLIGKKAFIIETEGKAWKIVYGVDDGVTPSVAEGEIKIYSMDSRSDSTKAYVHLKNNGVVEISNGGSTPNIEITNAGRIVLNGGTEYAVAYARLKTAFDLLVTEFNAHTHLHNPGLITPQVPTATPLPQSVADMTTAQSNTVLVP